MRRTLIVTCMCAVLVFAIGCERLADGAPDAPLQTAVVVEIVATVGGHAIGAADVRERMALEGIDAEAALEALIEEELLLQEAARRGWVEDPEVARSIDRTMVRALLHDLEKENTPEGLPAQQVRKDFERNREQLQVPERRASWHVLAKADTAEARKVAASVLAELEQASDPEEVFKRYTEGAADAIGVPVVAEKLPPMTTKAEIEKPYKDALFSAKTLGPLKEPVHTAYGWHAIVVTDIQPGEVRTLSDAEEEIRERLSRKQRFEKLVEVVQRLEAEGLVEYRDAVVERLMTVRDLPMRAE